MPKITVPLGPQHPALKEPGRFMLTLDGEIVDGASLRLGYNHRGIEKAAESRSYLQNIYLIERVCGICSHSHTTAYVTAVEEIAGVNIPDRAKAIRMIIGELERLHSHFLWLGVGAHEIGFDTLFMYSWRDRETVLDALEMLSGNRVHYSINTLGGVRHDITAEHVKKLEEAVKIVEERTAYYIKLATTESTMIARTKNVGMLPKEVATKLNAVGPLARASGVGRDMRKDDPYLLYDKMDFNVITTDSCDVFGRLYVRVFEVLESCKILKQLLAAIPEGPVTAEMPKIIPAGRAVARYEAPRGEDVHYVLSNGKGNSPERFKMRAPTLANFESVAYMLKGGYLADVPIVIAAIDPCFSCTDRVTVTSGGSKNEIDWNDLRLKGIEFYKEKGIDFSKL